MKLIDRLKPHYAKQLKQHVKDYPTTYGYVVEDLKKCKYVHNIMYTTFDSLNSMELKSVTDAYQMFENI